MGIFMARLLARLAVQTNTKYRERRRWRAIWSQHHLPMFEM